MFVILALFAAVMLSLASAESYYPQGGSQYFTTHATTIPLDGEEHYQVTP